MYLKQLPSGKWQYIVQHQGVRCSGSAGTRAQAQQAGAEALLVMGTAPTVGTATVGDLLCAHLADQDYAATTRVDLQRIIDKLPDDIKRVRVRDVEPVTVAGWYRRLERNGWTTHRVRKLHTLLGSAWNRARRYEWAKRNVIRDVDKPRAHVADVHPPTESEVRAILAACNGRVAVYLRVAAIAGARRGELVGLQWEDLNIAFSASGGTTGADMVVRRSTAQIPGTAGPVVSHGKTGKKGHRVVSLDAATADLLRQHRHEQVGRALANGLPSPMWVFSHDAGVTPWRGDYISREFRRASARAGVTDVRLHDLRHYMATSMLSAGVPVSVVAHRLGHSSPSVTHAVYSHFERASDEDAASQLGARLG